MSQPALQAGFDERIQITVQHCLGVACLDAGAQILDARLVQHVGAYLATSADVRLGVFQGLLAGTAILHLQLVEL